MMELQEFLSQALEPDPHLRKGQKLIASLGITRPDLYDRMNERDAADCYYEDDKIWSTLEWLRKNW